MLLHCSLEQGSEREESWEVRDAAAVKLGSQGMLHCRAEIRSCVNENVLVSGGCDTEEWCPVPTDLLVLPLIQFFHILFRASISLIPCAGICLVQLRA